MRGHNVTPGYLTEPRVTLAAKKQKTNHQTCCLLIIVHPFTGIKYLPSLSWARNQKTTQVDEYAFCKGFMCQYSSKLQVSFLKTRAGEPGKAAVEPAPNRRVQLQVQALCTFINKEEL